jgi:hypothetical protein
MASNAIGHFQTLTGYVDQLITIHGRLQAGRGRRHQQDAIHRAGVVLVVAAWESYVEQVVLESISAIEIDAGVGGAVPPGNPIPNWARHVFASRRAEVTQVVKKFNTPSAVNVRDLLNETLEFQPWPHWAWHAGRRQWDQEEVRRRLNTWLDVRHSVAHGGPLPPDVPWLNDPQGRARLTLRLLVECKSLFSYVSQRTDAALRDHLIHHYHVAAPWP